MEENKKCKYCGGDITIMNPTGNCCHLEYPDYTNKNLLAPASISSDLALAKSYLKETGLLLSPDAVCNALWSGTFGHITGSTLGRKFREAAAKGELVKSYYFNDKGRKIAQYAHKEQI